MASSLIPSFADVRALVVGDCMLDRYVHGLASRISPEAPVAVVAIARRDACLGGAANVAAGMKALGAQVSLAGIIGADEDGAELRRLAIRDGIGDELLSEHREATTVCKTRVLADRHQQLLRLDDDGDSYPRATAALRLLPEILTGLGAYDVVVLCDYEKGTLPVEVLRQVIAGCRELRIPVIVDPKKPDFSAYRGASVVTPNRLELERACGRSLPTLADVDGAAREVRDQFGFERLLCTCGAEGMVLAGPECSERFRARPIQVADVTGAGDTVVAILAAALGAGRTLEEGCGWAVLGATIAVGKPQVHVVRRSELEQAQLRSSPKILSRDKLREGLSAPQREGWRIVFTNGCFDILHAGHLAYLEEAKRLGDILVVGLNTDASVRRLKGSSRPRIHQEHRAALLAGLACVDYVVLFDEDTPESLLNDIRPDVLTKGGDYEVTQIVGAEFVRSYGGEVVVLGMVDGISTSLILQHDGC